MADGANPSIKARVSEAEWQTRVELAALYRLVALHGWDDMIFTHISARVPGPEHHFLINPYGFYFDEITASSLVKVDLEGNIVQDTTHFINPAGFTIHSAVHAAREDAKFVIHLHTVGGVGVAAQAEGLLPISQNACLLQHQVAYHGYEGLALHHDERERLVADLGDKPLMLLRNHGTLAVGGDGGAGMDRHLLPGTGLRAAGGGAVGRTRARAAGSDAAQEETKEQGPRDRLYFGPGLAGRAAAAGAQVAGLRRLILAAAGAFCPSASPRRPRPAPGSSPGDRARPSSNTSA